MHTVVSKVRIQIWCCHEDWPMLSFAHLIKHFFSNWWLNLETTLSRSFALGRECTTIPAVRENIKFRSRCNHLADWKYCKTMTVSTKRYERFLGCSRHAVIDVLLCNFDGTWKGIVFFAIWTMAPPGRSTCEFPFEVIGLLMISPKSLVWFPLYNLPFSGLLRATRPPERVTNTPPPTTKVFHRFPNQFPLRGGVSIHR